MAFHPPSVVSKAQAEKAALDPVPMFTSIVTLENTVFVTAPELLKVAKRPIALFPKVQLRMLKRLPRVPDGYSSTATPLMPLKSRSTVFTITT